MIVIITILSTTLSTLPPVISDIPLYIQSISIPRSLAIGPRIEPGYAVNKMSDIKTSIAATEPDHIHPLKKDYISISAMPQADHPLWHRTFAQPANHTQSRSDNMGISLISSGKYTSYKI